MKSYTCVFTIKPPVAILLLAALLSTAAGAGAGQFDHTHAAYDALLKQFVAHGRVDYQGLKSEPSVLDHYLDSLAGISEATFSAWTESGQLAFLINFKWYGKDFIDRFSPATGFSGLDQTERAVAHFSSGYLSAADGDYLKSGADSVKYLDCDWSLNEK